jgi:CRISPR type I-E-associated protein CasB/Cse2
MTNEREEIQPTVGGVALGWWSRLQPETRQDRRRSGDPGALARLRRADLLDAAMEEVTIDLFHRLKLLVPFHGETLVERTALIAGVLAHVRENENRKVAAAAGEKAGEDQRVLHPLRLRRLFATRSAPDCLIAFRRLVLLLGKKTNVADLAESLMDWPDDLRGDKRRTRWAFDYYGAGSAAPEDHDQAAA